MRIKIGDSFPVPASIDASEPMDFYQLCRGRHESGVNLNRGIFYYANIGAKNSPMRIPAFLLYSDNTHRLSETNPWLDIIDVNDGYALYHGDNRKPGAPPFSSDGNQTIMRIADQHAHPEFRKLAPPMILFERARIPGSKKSYRRFAGYGVPREMRIQSQHSRRGTFTNLAIELVLFNLTAEAEQFDWDWIDQRRDPSLTPDEALLDAPVAWKQWVKGGEHALTACRRRVFGATITGPKDQRQTMSCHDKEVNKSIYDFFHDTATVYQFEGLASWVASRVLGKSCSRGWVTPRVDGGIDFISRLDIGSQFSNTVVIVLGQAKCIRPDSQVVGIDLARTVARLRRGWIGVVVTTGTFATSAQKEVLSDQYPLVLINGARLVREVQEEMARTGLTLEDILHREAEWYNNNQSMLAADRVVFGDHWGRKVG